MAKPMAIAIIIAVAAAPMYMSVGGRLTTGYGDAVEVAAVATKDVSAEDG